MPMLRLRRTPFQPTDEQKRQFWGVYNAMFRGLSDDDELAKISTMKRMVLAPPGSVIKEETKLERNAKYSAKFFVMLDHAYSCWEPEADRTKKNFEGRPIAKSRERFRKDVIVEAGFYEVHFGIDGQIHREAKSISFANMDDTEFEELYGAVATVLLRDILKRYTRADLDEVVERLLDFT